MIKTENFEKVEIESKENLRNWLSENYAQKDSVWLVTFKKNIIDKYVSVGEVLDELLCFGWIDGIRRKLDEEKTMQLISPRRMEYWSGTYKKRVEKLIKENKMQPSGLLSIENSKKNGTWDFYDDVDKLIIPDDLKKALNEKEGAFEFFESINMSSKRFALRWLKLAKTESTRKKRIQELLDLSAKGEKLKGS